MKPPGTSRSCPMVIEAGMLNQNLRKDNTTHTQAKKPQKGKHI